MLKKLKFVDHNWFSKAIREHQEHHRAWIPFYKHYTGTYEEFLNFCFNTCKWLLALWLLACGRTSQLLPPLRHDKLLPLFTHESVRCCQSECMSLWSISNITIVDFKKVKWAVLSPSANTLELYLRRRHDSAFLSKSIPSAAHPAAAVTTSSSLEVRGGKCLQVWPKNAPPPHYGDLSSSSRRTTTFSEGSRLPILHNSCCKDESRVCVWVSTVMAVEPLCNANTHMYISLQ